MAEFPDLGKHCSYSRCNLLDFLPMRCDACKEVYCSGHIMYDTHECHSSYKKNVQVPVCPLCNRPVPTAKGELPDVKVGEHIDNRLPIGPSDGEEKSRLQEPMLAKALVPILCRDCKRNFCIKHRHADDHQCNKRHNNPAFRQAASQAALHPSSTMNDEALAKALHQKLNTGGKALTREELDRQLAEQIQREEYQRQQQGGARHAGHGSDRCAIN
ncbi:zinc finger protein [Aphelenchoides avenae]|nr:zinc finger protein [Aphelenchus avenae]